MPEADLNIHLLIADIMEQAQALWGIRFVSVQDQVSIEGSPQRSMGRAVFADEKGRSFLVEMFNINQMAHKDRIAGTLYDLKHQGFDTVLVPVRSLEGRFLHPMGACCIQLTLFVPSTGLERPGWIECPQIGCRLADVLIELNQAAGRIRTAFPFFSIKAYIYKLFRDMDADSPSAGRRFLPILRYLEAGFMDVHDSLPSGFCHGDFHPLNVIWHGKQVTAVIDWEFAGIKPDCYDAANLIGCAGIEHPEGLAMPMVTRFLAALDRSCVISPLCRRWLPEYVLALRFAWLSEWLRQADHAMIDTELAFMNILVRHMGELKDIWNINNY